MSRSRPSKPASAPLPSVAAAAHPNTALDSLRTSADLVAVAHFLALFGPHLKLSPVPNIDTLEDEYPHADSPVIFAVHAALLRRLLHRDHDILLFTWEQRVREFAARHVAVAKGKFAVSAPLHHAASADNIGNDGVDNGDDVHAELVDPLLVALLDLQYVSLSNPARVGVTLALIHLLLEHDADLHAYIDTLDPDSLIVLPLGKDESGAVYWNFADQRLYKEMPTAKSKGLLTESTWSTPCVLPGEWHALTEQLKSSKNADQRQLHKDITTILLPAYANKLQQRQKAHEIALMEEAGLLKRSNRLQVQGNDTAKQARAAFIEQEKLRLELLEEELRVRALHDKKKLDEAASAPVVPAAMTAAQKLAAEQQKARDQRRQDRLAIVAQQEKEAEREALAAVQLNEAALRVIIAERQNLPAISIPTTKFVFTSNIANGATHAVSRGEITTMTMFIKRRHPGNAPPPTPKRRKLDGALHAASTNEDNDEDDEDDEEIA